MNLNACKACQGTRLNPIARAVLFGGDAAHADANAQAGVPITEVARLSVAEAELV